MISELTYPPFEVHVTVVGHCEIPMCKKPFIVFDENVPVGQRLPVFVPPEHWNVVNGHLYCPEHKITIFDIINGIPVVRKGIGL